MPVGETTASVPWTEAVKTASSPWVRVIATATVESVSRVRMS
jgi:hypothetical protein